MPVIFVATHHQLYKKILSNIEEVKARNGRIIAVVTKGDEAVKKIAEATEITNWFDEDWFKEKFVIYVPVG